jgi:transcriptional regulator with AAA-type ATPase domain
LLAPAVEEPAKETEQPVKERFTEGPAPAVANADVETPARSASQLAFEDTGNTKELKEKVTRLVTREFGGDYQKAFQYYAADGSTSIDRFELQSLLEDASVGTAVTRAAWVTNLLAKLDTDEDHKVEWDEFERATSTRPPRVAAVEKAAAEAVAPEEKKLEPDEKAKQA